MTRLGILPIGGSDGMVHLHAGEVLVRGRQARLLGEPTRVDLSGIPQAQVGDDVVIIGRQGGEENSPAEAAEHQRSSPLALALEIRPSVARVYLPQQKV